MARVTLKSSHVDLCLGLGTIMITRDRKSVGKIHYGMLSDAEGRVRVVLHSLHI